ncbi:MAG: DUF3387 domain-containing protein, partial [Paludibacteraceae bacterium]|nr:DUF3387 domain-containing protein [Paludibacteraceae bacterium]
NEQVIEELLNLAKQIQAAQKEGEELGLNADELAFYDALTKPQAIKDFYEKRGEMRGFKAAGGISTAKDAVLYYTIVEQILGNKWLNSEYFRIGASSLANDILTAIEGKEVKYF